MTEYKIKPVTVAILKADPEITVYLTRGTQYLSELGFTDHGLRHASLVSVLAKKILKELNFNERMCELAGVAGYLHDISNIINRYNHGVTGAVMAYTILNRMQMPPEEIALVISAIGNHEEASGNPINPIAAALILADKSDVHRSRVTNKDFAKFDIHDRVNYAAESSNLIIDKEKAQINLNLEINPKFCSVMEYFEIFLQRMIMCRRAADFLNCKFGLIINNNELL